MSELPAEHKNPEAGPFQMSLKSVAVTDVGWVRQRNEDRFLCDDDLQLYGVADGVGGLPGGAEAAQCAVEAIRRRMAADRQAINVGSITVAANEDVVELGSRFNPQAGIATTLTWGVFRGDLLHLAHVGDSRCYALRSGVLECLTMDHTVENEANARRARGENVWVADYNRHAITRCIGQPTEPDVDLIVRPVLAGDRYLFCTDGVTGALSDGDLKEIMSWILAPEHIARGLIELASQRGGRDNATAVLVIVGSAQP